MGEYEYPIISHISNSYGVRGIPEGALYGTYDSINGEWTGIWFSTREDAQAAANADPEFYGSEQFGIVGVEEDEFGADDWIEPEEE